MRLPKEFIAGIQSGDNTTRVLHYPYVLLLVRSMYGERSVIPSGASINRAENILRSCDELLKDETQDFLLTEEYVLRKRREKEYYFITIYLKQ